ncbi:MAG: DNA gyrase inhibitor YacG [Proteobacteria bacterium]|nr:DNA gyrase inhibitor YacG [Pseudomonadota bacterium]
MKAKCIICGEPCRGHEENELYPFCSRRCQLIDLGRWLDGDYRIPGNSIDEDDPDRSDGSLM